MSSRRLAAVGVGLVFGGLSGHAVAASQPTNQQLRQMVHHLKQRLDKVQARQEQDQATTAQTPSITPSSKQTGDTGAQGVKIDWSKGAPTISSVEGDYSFTPIGRIQFDASTTKGAGGARNATGTEFRRLWLGFDGRLPGPFGYRAQFNFAGNDVTIEDAYISAEHTFALGQGVVYLGNKKYDLGINGTTSSNWIWFTDRNTVTQSIKPQAGSHFTGLTSAFYGNGDWHVALAVNKGSVNNDADSSGNLSVLSRVHIDPIATDDYILHLGAFGFYDRFHGDDDFSSNYRLATHGNTKVRIGVATNNEPDHGTGYGVELGAIAGRFAASAEFGQRQITFNDSPDLNVAAYTGQIGYSLTGEQFGYSTKKGSWTHPEVRQPVTEGGLGAWQLVARYQAVDYASANHYRADRGHGTTVGLSWYLNDYMRVLLDDTWWKSNNRTDSFVPSGADGGHHDGNTVAARAQVVF